MLLRDLRERNRRTEPLGRLEELTGEGEAGEGEAGRGGSGDSSGAGEEFGKAPGTIAESW